LLRGAPDKQIWAGKYNGVGGHLEEREDVLAGARREILEETGLTVDCISLRGIVNIQTAVPGTGILLFVFVATTESCELRPSAEGSLEWVPISRVGELPVVEDVPMLLERALGNEPGSRPFFASYTYPPQGAMQVTFAAD
jgi:8-oxo-dGTP diphosphatase